jgi:hypothetical protein
VHLEHLDFAHFGGNLLLRRPRIALFETIPGIVGQPPPFGLERSPRIFMEEHLEHLPSVHGGLSAFCIQNGTRVAQSPAPVVLLKGHPAFILLVSAFCIRMISNQGSWVTLVSFWQGRLDFVWRSTGGTCPSVHSGVSAFCIATIYPGCPVTPRPIVYDSHCRSPHFVFK